MIWRNILKDDFTEEKEETYWPDTLKRSSEYTNDIKCGRETFHPMAKTFATSYEKIFEDHGRAVIYLDTIEFFIGAGCWGQLVCLMILNINSSIQNTF